MEWLRITLNLYAKAFSRGAALAVRNWPVFATLFIYTAIWDVGAMVAVRLGLLGGFVLGFLWAACASSFLSLVENIVRTGRVTIEDFRNSFGRYLWDVIGVMFAFWILFGFAGPLIAHMPNGRLILLCVEIAVFVFFNAVPELIYLGHYTLLQLLGESYAFISENWIEWFPPNFLIAAAFIGITAIPLEWPASLAIDAVLALFAYFAMVVRGFLFLELQGSSRRGRAFRYRVG